MKKHHMMVLVAAAVLAVLAAFWTTSVREPDGGSVTEQLLLPGLAESLNQVSTVALVGPGNEPIVTLSRGETDWTVDQAGGYRADTGKLRKMLLALSEARIAEAKTASPDNYHYLGVEDVSAPDAGGVRVTLTGAGEPVAVIVGKRPTRAGTYVRVDSVAQSYLIDQTIDIDGTPGDWLDKRVTDIPSSRIRAVTVTHADGEQVVASKTARGESDFLVEGIPEGRSLSSPGAANALGTALQGLDLTDVMPLDDFDAGDSEVVVTEYVTFSGVRLAARSVEKDGKYYAWFDVDFDQDTAARFAPQASPGEQATGSSDETGASDQIDEAGAAEGDSGEPGAVDAGADEAAAAEPSPADVAPADFTGAQEEVAELKAALEGWVFEIPSYKRQQMVRRMDALLAAGE